MPLISGENRSLIEWSLVLWRLCLLVSLFCVRTDQYFNGLCSEFSSFSTNFVLKIGVIDWTKNPIAIYLWYFLSFISKCCLAMVEPPWELFCWAWPQCQLSNYVGYVGVSVVTVLECWWQDSKTLPSSHMWPHWHSTSWLCWGPAGARQWPPVQPASQSPVSTQPEPDSRTTHVEEEEEEEEEGGHNISTINK